MARDHEPSRPVLVGQDQKPKRKRRGAPLPPPPPRPHVVHAPGPPPGRPTVEAVCYRRTDTRSRIIAEAMCQGIQAAGDRAWMVSMDRYFRGALPGDMAVFYGFKATGKEIFADYLKAGKHVLFIDLGYWGRRLGGRYGGYHRVTFDSRHPSDLVMRFRMPPDRIERIRKLWRAGPEYVTKDTNLVIKPWRNTDKHAPVLLAGSQKKSAESYDMDYMAWEMSAVETLRKHTKREIIYRPKPKDEYQRPIDGTIYSGRNEKLSELFNRVHAVVTHHSNVGIDALIEGVPVFCFDGIHRPLALADLRKIENPYRPSDAIREQWLANCAYWQYSVAEMRDGTCWRTLRDMGVF